MIRKYLSPIGELTLVVENGALAEVRLDGAEAAGGGTDWNEEDEGILKEV